MGHGLGEPGQRDWTRWSLIRGRAWQGLMEEKGSQDVSPGWQGSGTKHWLFIAAWLTVLVCVRTRCRARAFLTSLLRHSRTESGVKWKSRSHSVGIHGSGPCGSVQAPLFTDKAPPAGPRHTHTEKGATQGEERSGGGLRYQGGGSVWLHSLSLIRRCVWLPAKSEPVPNQY